MSRKKTKSLGNFLKKIGDTRYYISIHKTGNHMHAYLFDTTKPALVPISGASTAAKSFITSNSGLKNTNTILASLTLGKVFKDKVQRLGISLDQVCFNRNGNIYHGRVKAFCEGVKS